MNIQTKYIEKLKAEKIFSDIYTDRYDESIYGFIFDFNEEFLILEQFTDIGEADGIAVLKRENISRIKWLGNSIKTAEIFALKAITNENIGKIKIDNIQNIIKSIQNEFGYVTLYIQDVDSEMCIIGEIIEMDADTLIIKEYGTYASLDRKMLMLSIHEITKVECDGQYERNLHELFNKNNWV
ncbi:hypothetical protein WFZ85_00625 [Flavobacterium sp. j3]|uniref:Uncharacterized protein n=1 Tax=Flavobacterium aureirubrum TaxID=3133147 RepID=A0ABU9N043_9FLAO